MKAWIGAVALVGLMASGAAMAAENKDDGNELLAQCQQYIKAMDGEKYYDQIAAGLCGGFVPGVSGTVSYLYGDLKNEAKFCMPKSVTYGQTVRIVVKYLKDNPKRLNRGRVDLVWTALQDAYPCK